MNQKRYINIQGAVLDKHQLSQYLEKIAADHMLKNKSDKSTCPISRLNDNYQFIKYVYKILNNHIKLGIPIHPAGEWILDNLYVIEEIVKNISKNLTVKKYCDFLSIADGRYEGFARIYVLATEMVSFTDGIINDENLENMLISYQNKKSLSMEEIWNIGIFLQIALIENIRQICEKIYYSQLQKYKVEEIINNTIEKNKRSSIKDNVLFVKNYINLNKRNQIKYTFVEYMSYRLKKYGKFAYPYIKILESEVNKAGLTISEIIKKEHFDVAAKKVSMGNSITSLKEISRISFLEIFEKINRVEDALKEDPAKQYEKMDSVSRACYRGAIEEISKRTKLSEIYIAKKCLELCRKNIGKGNNKKTHIGYYLISEGKTEFINYLLGTNKKNTSNQKKTSIYIGSIWGTTIIITAILSVCFYKDLYVKSYLIKYLLSFIFFILIVLPIQNGITKIIQYTLSKIIKPKIIPKLDFDKGIPKEYTTMVVIPTIIKNKEQVKKLFEKLEVFYIANKSDNIYFTLLGDCSSSKSEIEEYDSEVIKEGICESRILNQKYPDERFDKFNFVYRKRIWNEKEESFLGWERKRGLLEQFNEYVLGNIENPFRMNTIETCERKIPQIKYVITLDCDTDLTLNSAFELVGAMAHILNKPVMNEEQNLVISGHGIIAPRVGISLENARKNIFTMLYAGAGGTDSYSNAISDLYQDVFDEGIYAGKGIYDLEVFSKVLKNQIKENTVLSHDLLEGCYLRAGFASDILLMDGYPSNYLSERKRLYRWTRGDWQVTKWLFNSIKTRDNKRIKNPLSLLSRYKIISNIFRSKQEEKILVMLLYLIVLKIGINIPICYWLFLALGLMSISAFIDLINNIFSLEKNSRRTRLFNKKIPEIFASIYRLIITFANLPDKAFVSIKAQIITLHRMNKSHKHLLEWETSEEAEKSSKQKIENYYKTMILNPLLGMFGIIISLIFINSGINFFIILISAIWLVSPFIMYRISKIYKAKKGIELLDKNEKQVFLEIAYKTWIFFKENLNQKNNYLPPDNWQEDRKPKLVPRTSSTNIGLALLAVISSYDLKYETLENTISLLNNIINSISILPKWNGHLYNWYNIETLEPLNPKFVSSVDSGNFIGYLYVLKQFLIELKEKIDKKSLQKKNIGNEEKLEKVNTMIKIVSKIIDETNFTKLYDKKIRLFSVGFNAEEDKLIDSYYDLLASEARQTSLIAIAKRDVSSKHWNNLNRSLTELNKYKGLISWSGTAFEYLMPSINIPNYEGSIIDESCKFMIMSQIEYSKKLQTPWGLSEAAFNLKDLYGNYQYKAFGIPWLGLKRGLADEIVVSAYGTILAALECPKEVIQNLRKLKAYGMEGKYGLYESIDFTPTRVKEQYAVVKTYMAHHQGLILLTINNLFNEKILQKRFMKNPEMKALDILLQEKMPENMMLTKEEKEKIEKIKYVDYEDYNHRSCNKTNYNLNISNVISNDKYSVLMDQYGNGFSRYKEIQINRFKATDDEAQGIMFFIKNIKNNRIWTNSYSKYMAKPDKYNIDFYSDISKISRIDGDIKTVTKVIVSNDDPTEIRQVLLSNIGNMNQTLEITSYLEPIISNHMQDYAHKAFNNLFLSFEYVPLLDSILVKRKSTKPNEQDLYLAIRLIDEDNLNLETEFEINKEKFNGRFNMKLPEAVENSMPLSKKIETVINPIVALKKIINLQPEETKKISLIISVSEDKEKVLKQISKASSGESIERAFELSRAKIEAETRYLGLKGKDVGVYQRMLSYLMLPNKYSNKEYEGQIYEKNGLWKYGISGDLPLLLLKINNINDIDVVKDVIKAYEYYRTKNIQIDLVILNEEEEKYENYVKEAVEVEVLNKNLGYLFNIKGGIFCLNNINDRFDKKLIESKADVVIDATKGRLEEQIDDLESTIKENTVKIGYDIKNEVVYEEKPMDNKLCSVFNESNLKYFNEYGGFISDGKEYIIKTNKNNKLPSVWSHILANDKFGTLITQNMGGYTWMQNCKLNKITAWSNDVVTDIPSEILYFKDMETDKKWSMGFNPMPDENDYYAIYGFGYAKFSHNSDGLEQEMNVFVPQNDNVKVNILHLNNLKANARNIKLVYYIKPVLGEDEILTTGDINLEYNRNLNMIVLSNVTRKQGKVFISSSEKIVSYTGSRASFLKESNLANPDGLEQIELNRENTYGKDAVLALEIMIRIEALESKDISFIIGSEELKDNENEINSIQDLGYKYSNINNCWQEFEKTKRYWSDMVNAIKVKTPSESANILLNGWLIYQTIVSRLFARTGFYQSGGAYGFRDQLQDTIAIKYFDSEIAKRQIIKHSKHQFIEGDVEHWWHEETSRGIRTRFSDDLLWLPYIVCDYINYTGDYSILDENTSYLEGKKLNEYESERYDLYVDSKIYETLYEHCIRAIEKSLKFGKNGLPLIGSGDWNDGFSNVGIMGKGESVWLGFFLYDVLKKMIRICQYKNDEEKVKKYTDVMEELKKALNSNGWDGRWFKRAFMDDGEILGSLQNEECKIDSISQSWAVISEAGDNDKKYISIDSLENHLIDKSNGIIKLLDPPFEKSKLEPGYIKAYIPGTRENGGQYTHAAIWTIIAETLLNLDNKAFELYKMINPIEHSKTRELANKYAVEPYVVAADVYGSNSLIGRGGWTWYTGSSSWMYVAGIKYILGIDITDKEIKIEPHVPDDWTEFKVKFKYKGIFLNMKIKRKIDEKRFIKLNEEKIEGNIIKFEDLKKTNNIEAYVI